MSDIPEILEPREPVFNNLPEGQGAMPWYQIWLEAITKPSEETFRKLIALPNAKASSAYLWVFLSYVAVIAIVGIVQMTLGASSLTSRFSSYGMDVQPLEDIGVSLLGFLCASPFLAVIVLLGFMLNTALVQWAAKLFGGTGSYDKLAFASGAIYAPMALVSGVLSALGLIPVVGMCFSVVTFGLSIYMIVLNVLAVKAVNNLDTGKAVGAVLLPGILLFLLFCCCVLIVVLLAGVSFGDIFSGVSQGMY
jgi:hypothetical protein